MLCIRNEIDSPNGVFDVYDDSNPQMLELGDTDETV